MTDPKTTFSSGEISKLFGIAKRTLARWERIGRITPPDRDWRNYRVYTLDHVREVAAIMGIEPPSLDQLEGR